MNQCSTPRLGGQAIPYGQCSIVRLSMREWQLTLLDLPEQDVALCDGRDPAEYTGDTRSVIDRVVAADAVVVGTPMYRGSYTGRLKNLFDVLPNDALEESRSG